MTWVIACVPAEDNIAVEPCGAIGGVAHMPVVFELGSPETATLDTSQDLYVWSITVIGLCFLVGFVVGQILRVIRAS